MFGQLFEYAVHATLVLGVLGLIAGFFLGFIPLIGKYKLPLQVISIVLFSVGLWFSGSIAKDKQWSAKVAELEVKLAEARVKGEVVTTEVVTKVVKQKEIIKEKGETITEYINVEVVKNNETCTLDNSVILSHNAAALNDTSILKPTSEVSTVSHNELAKSKIKLAPKK
jgi:hypothetical protein